MLVEFRVANFRSFHEEQVLSLAASRDEEHPGNVIPGPKLNLLKAAAIYGANASGKSNLVKAIGFMKSFVRTSATKMNVGDRIAVVPFRLRRDARQRPSRFEVTLILDQVPYQYGFSATRERVHDEWLIAYPLRSGRHLYERRFNPQTRETQWAFRWGLKKHEDLLRERTRDNGLALSRGAELNIPELVEVFRWFLTGLSVYDLSVEPALLFESAERFVEDAEFQRKAMRFVQDADLGIKGIRITEELPDASFFADDFLKQLPDEDRQRILKTFTRRVVHAVHSVPGCDEEEVFGFQDAESKGTQRFFALAAPWLDAMENGTVVVVDELDCSMHPVLTRKLIQFFQNPEHNAKGAQLVFATHDSSLMDQTLFRRDQIWLVEKDANQASRLSSLWDFKDKPRKGEAIEKRYLAGRYGGVPDFGPSFEALEAD